MSRLSARVVPPLLAAAALAFLMAQGVSASLPRIIAAAVVFCYVALACGEIGLRVLRARDLSVAAAWPLGVLSTGLALWALVAMLGVTAATAFALWGGAVAVCQIATSRMTASEPPPDRKDLVGFALCCAFTAAWCKDISAAPDVLAKAGYLPAWIDYFLHGGVVAQFGDPRAIDRGGIWLPDVPAFLYHYGSYLPAAAFAVPLDQPGLTLALSVGLPLGILCLACGAYALGASLAGASGGIAALVALFVIPDASNYWLRNGFYSFHWNMFASPGVGYALAAGMLALVFLQRWARTGDAIALAGSAALVAAVFAYRFHVLLLLLPGWLAAVAIASPLVRRRWRLFFIAGAALALGALLAYDHLPNIGDAASWALGEGQALERFLRQVHTRQEPTAYTGLYVQVLNAYGDAIGYAFGMILAYPAALGALLVLFPVALFLERDRLEWKGVDAFPVALVVLYPGLMLLAPTPRHHDATDYVHRPFVLLYAVLSIWTFALFVRWLLERRGQSKETAWKALAAGALFALAVPWFFAADMARPKFDWGKPLAAYAVDPGIVSAAAFLYTHARPGDLFAVGRLPHRYAHLDDGAELVALSSTPAYLARVWIHLLMDHERAEIARGRYNALVAIESSPDRRTAFEQLRQLGVRWYVATSPGAPWWDADHRHSAYSSGKVAVYEIPR